MSYAYNPVYSHFQGDDISRIEKIERTVVETIIKSHVPDKDRSWGKVFELKHSSSVIQIGRFLAERRGLDVNIVAAMCALHDVYVFETGKVTNHARLGVPIAKKILENIGTFTDEEINTILKGVGNHSDKHIVSKDPYIEFMKDVDVFDCSIYEGVHDAYVYEKSPEICKTYFARVQRVREELGLPYDSQWDNFEMIKKD
ncbi:MAG: hypothetical protein COX81_02695 [Candidatus Magasanikbacteria bacterium CG_4_10_14_0_2_um_filter_37_12]|uniref:HD domain-containing protein n=1 Tax=Candidatus Magasanikbacteria bacterium CG_4_10_14_0_2_um_filter_37_12 TaxID=1974637 RepID=A0A2M7V7R7_9BACT|nr:MAG: hypothetical protein COX81_02695 [Candidatus Magasanikbacteria bacterium CG_4_10_14_0_2_um_filter_37_12]